MGIKYTTSCWIQSGCSFWRRSFCLAKHFLQLEVAVLSTGLILHVILILLVVNTQHYSQHAKRKEVPYKIAQLWKNMVQFYLMVPMKMKTSTANMRNSAMSIMFSSKSKTNKLEVTQILRNILQTPDFTWLVFVC